MSLVQQESLSAIGSAIITGVARYLHTDRKLTSPILDEKKYDLDEVKAKQSELAAAAIARARAKRHIEQQLSDYETQAEEEFDANGRVSSETSVALSSTEKSLAKAAAAANEAQADLETAKRNSALALASYQTVALREMLFSPDCPAERANAIIVEYLELLPLIMMSSAQVYSSARRDHDWNPHNMPLPYWHGPAGALLDALQTMTWPEWPASLRPSWAPAHGPSPSAEDVFERFSRMLKRPSEVAATLKEVAHEQA